jgi:hypothetical protein
MFTQSISTKKLIREMDASSIEDYINTKFERHYNGNKQSLIETSKISGSDIYLCLEVYKQLTGKEFDFNTLSDAV